MSRAPLIVHPAVAAALNQAQGGGARQPTDRGPRSLRGLNVHHVVLSDRVGRRGGRHTRRRVVRLWERP